MILYYEVCEKSVSWEGPNFRTIEECTQYIKGQVFLSKRMYVEGRTIDDYEIIPIYADSVADLLCDEYGVSEYDEFLKTLDK